MVAVRVLRDSVSPRGIRLTTLLIPPPGHALAALLAHRELSVTAGPLAAVVTCTGPDWEAFFWRRCREDEIGHARTLARACYLAWRESTPGRLDYGQWHAPLVDAVPVWFPRNSGDVPPGPVCASASAVLVAAGLDADPGAAEHQATPLLDATLQLFPEWRGNLGGWLQYRVLAAPRLPPYHPHEEELAAWAESDLTGAREGSA